MHPAAPCRLRTGGTRSRSLGSRYDQAVVAVIHADHYRSSRLATAGKGAWRPARVPGRDRNGRGRLNPPSAGMVRSKASTPGKIFESASPPGPWRELDRIRTDLVP